MDLPPPRAPPNSTQRFLPVSAARKASTCLGRGRKAKRGGWLGRLSQSAYLAWCARHAGVWQAHPCQSPSCQRMKGRWHQQHRAVQPVWLGICSDQYDMNTAVLFSKASDEWRTPEDFFVALDAEFGFDVDVAATEDNCWKDSYYGPDHRNPTRRDALVVPWGGLMCWLNPPYSKCREFMAKAAQEALKGCTVVCLVPSRTDTRWWHEHVWDHAKHQPRAGVEVRFLRGRLAFVGATNSAPFPSVVIIFRSPQ